MSDMQRLYEDIEIPLLAVLADMEMRGALVDQSEVARVKQIYAEALAENAENIKQFVPADMPDFNIRSPEQVSVLLFEVLKLEPPREAAVSDKGFISTNAKDVLDKMEHHPALEIVKDDRKVSKLIGYCIPLESPHAVTGRVHTNFNQARVRTGRLSSSDPINFQNIPSRSDLGKKLRGCFVSPPGYVMLCADWDQMELRAEASYSRDPFKMKVYAEGGDIHDETCRRIYGHREDFATQQDRYRKMAKTANFLSQYRGGSKTLSARAEIPLIEAESLLADQRKLFTGSEAHYKEYCEWLMIHGYAETMLGRRQNLPSVHSPIPWAQEEAFRKGYSHHIQGSCADIVKRAMLRLAYGIRDQALDVKFILQVHDEIVMEVPPAHVGPLWDMIHECMQDVPEMVVSMPVSVKIGLDWLNSTDCETKEEAIDIATKLRLL